MKLLFIGLLTVSSLSAFAQTECGLNGSVQARIQDCSSQPFSSVGNYVLVTRTAAKIEVYKDTRSGLIWSDVLADEMSQVKAFSMCRSNPLEGGNISELNYRLPSLKDYKQAADNGILTSLPNMRLRFWTTEDVDSYQIGGSLYTYMRYFFDGESARSSFMNKVIPAKVRCVADSI
jgi:hypothetical protein